MSVLLEVVNQLYENIWNILLVVVAYLFYYWWAPPCKNFPPGVKGYPIIGAIPFFGKYPMRVIAEWSRKKYGPILSVRYGRRDCVVINTYDVLRKAFINNSSKYTNRPLTRLVYQVAADNGYAFRAGTNEWKIQRNFLKSKLNTFGQGNAEIELRVNTIAQMLVDVITNEEGKPFYIRDHFDWALSNNIIYVCFGKKFERDDERLKKLMHNMSNIFGHPETAGHVTTMMIYHYLELIPPFKESARRFRQYLHGIIEFVDEELADKKKSSTEDSIDFVDLFLKEKELRQEKDGFTDEQLRIGLWELIFGATDTASSTLLWALLCFLHFPQTKDKLYHEIHSFYQENPDINPSINQSDSLPYTMAFIQELFRFKTVAPFGNQRKTTANVELFGYHIPKGTTVIANLWAIHNDPDLWKDPKLFQPERHIDDDGKFVFSKKIIPFSIGGRSCPGEKFARAMVFLFLVNLVKSLEFEADPSSTDLPGLNDDINGFLYVPVSYKVIARPTDLEE